MTVLRVAQAQINATVGDLKGNGEKIAAWIDRARSLDADVVTFPELALSGYPPEDLLLKPRFLSDNLRALEALAARCHHIYVLVGFPDSSNGCTYNAAALLNDGHILGVYHKIELPNYGVFDEKRYFTPGKGCLVFSLRDCPISVNICEDIWIEGSPVESHAIEHNAQVALSISASPFHAGKFGYRRDCIVSRFAKTTRTAVFYNNLVGGQDELVFDGGTMVVAPDGRLIASAKRFEEDLLVTDWEVQEPAKPQQHAGDFIAVLPGIAPSRREPLAPRITADLEPVEEVYKALVLGTRDYVEKNGFRGVVLGLSGGIDSALTAAVAVDALGTAQVRGVTMPSQYTSAETFSDAGLVAKNLAIELITVPIGGVFQAYAQALEEPFRTGKTGLEFENLQARIRGNILMALSNRFGWLVLTTGNKSETAVGYCTLYGDMAGGFAVVKDVPKTLVYQLAEYVNRKAGREVIPESTILRAPSAELRPDQKDEDSLPPYPVLDPILKAYVEEDKVPDEIEGYDPGLVREIATLVDRNEYKRRQAPPGIKITPRAFGRDRRLPMTNRYVG